MLLTRVSSTNFDKAALNFELNMPAAAEVVALADFDIKEGLADNAAIRAARHDGHLSLDA